MVDITQDRNTPRKDGVLVPFPVAAGEVIPVGTMVCLNAAGFAVSAKDVADLKCVGCADERVDNTLGQDGDVKVCVWRNKTFNFANDGTLTQADVGKKVFIKDNQTVSKTANSAAGYCAAIDADGVWVLIQ